jgi:hypothetical protein
MRFVALNTYGGTPERRHAFSIFMDAFDLRLGVPAVDNYGGYLTSGQLAFVRRQAQLASKRGQTLVVLGHHDPRGNERGRRYHENEPFPTDPVSMGGFEEWNYDSTRWDSDPGDQREAETPGRNSGRQLLEILARYGGYYLSGHIHKDAREVYEPGSKLPGAVPVRRRLEFIRTTTASSSAKPGAYWGYRLIQVHGHRLYARDFAAEHDLRSVPAGNLWVTPVEGTVKELLLTNDLPRPMRLVVHQALPTRPEGYRFRARPEQGEPAAGEKPPRVLQVMPAGPQTSYWVELWLPAAPFPPDRRSMVQRRMRALPARGNQPPLPVIEAVAAGGVPLSAAEGGYDALVGQDLLLSAEGSSDPEGDRILAYLWQIGEERSARGPRVAHKLSGPGKRTVTLTLVDEAGARATVSQQINVKHPPPPGCRGCSTPPGGPAGGAAGLGLLVLLALLARAALCGRRRPEE